MAGQVFIFDSTYKSEVSKTVDWSKVL